MVRTPHKKSTHVATQASSISKESFSQIWTQKVLEFDVPEEKEPIFLQFQTTEADV